MSASKVHLFFCLPSLPLRCYRKLQPLPSAVCPTPFCSMVLLSYSGFRRSIHPAIPEEDHVFAPVVADYAPPGSPRWRGDQDERGDWPPRLSSFIRRVFRAFFFWVLAKAFAVM
jgi:hypothetical protein